MKRALCEHQEKVTDSGLLAYCTKCLVTLWFDVELVKVR